MRETLKFQGALGELERKRKSLEVRIEGLVLAMRDNLDPLLPAHKLSASVITSQAVDLESAYWELMEVRGGIEKARDLLER